MAASFVTSSLHLGHIATAMLPLCNNELTERCYHFGLTFVMKRPLNNCMAVCRLVIFIGGWEKSLWQSVDNSGIIIIFAPIY